MFKKKIQQEIGEYMRTIILNDVKSAVELQTEVIAKRMVQLDQQMQNLQNSFNKIKYYLQQCGLKAPICECGKEADMINVPDPRGRINEDGSTKTGNFCKECYIKLI